MDKTQQMAGGQSEDRQPQQQGSAPRRRPQPAEGSIQQQGQMQSGQQQGTQFTDWASI